MGNRLSKLDVRSGLALCLAVLATGCAQFPHRDVVKGPTTAEPLPPQEVMPEQTRTATGSIFRTATTKPLFEDRRPNQVGDILTVVINEDLNASKSKNTSANREGSIGFTPTSVPEAIGDFLSDQETDISGSNDFEGEGDSNASNTFRARITVTVLSIQPNGNLRVAGEKRIGLNQGVEFIKFSGVVNPRTVGADSTVVSTQVANARLEYYGDGLLDEAQEMGWFQRFFLNVAPL